LMIRQAHMIAADSLRFNIPMGNHMVFAYEFRFAFNRIKEKPVFLNIKYVQNTYCLNIAFLPVCSRNGRDQCFDCKALYTCKFGSPIVVFPHRINFFLPIFRRYSWFFGIDSRSAY
jgi:hypothetical protein